MDVIIHKKLLMTCSFIATVFFLPALFSSATSAATLGGVSVITKVMSHSAWQDSWGPHGMNVVPGIVEPKAWNLKEQRKVFLKRRAAYFGWLHGIAAINNKLLCSYKYQHSL